MTSTVPPAWGLAGVSGSEGVVSTGGGGVVAAGGAGSAGGVVVSGGEGVPPVGSVTGVTGASDCEEVFVASVGSVVVSVVTSVTGADTGFGCTGILTAAGTGVALAAWFSAATGTAILAILAARRWWAPRRVEAWAAKRRVELTGWTLACMTTGSLACLDTWAVVVGVA